MSNNHIFQTFRFFFQHFVSLYKYVDDAVFNEKRSVDTQRDLCSIVNRLTSRIAYRKRPPLKCHGNERYDNIYENRYVITSRRGGNREPIRAIRTEHDSAPLLYYRWNNTGNYTP